MNSIHNVDLNFLIGKRLQQACFGLNELILNFYPDTTITIFSKAELVNQQIHFLWISEKRQVDGFPINLVLEEQIHKVSKIENNNMKLHFTNEVDLILYDDLSSLESITINHNKEIYII